MPISLRHNAVLTEIYIVLTPLHGNLWDNKPFTHRLVLKLLTCLMMTGMPPHKSTRLSRRAEFCNLELNKSSAQALGNILGLVTDLCLPLMSRLDSLSIAYLRVN